MGNTDVNRSSLAIEVEAATAASRSIDPVFAVVPFTLELERFLRALIMGLDGAKFSFRLVELAVMCGGA